jgi:hypothetical protein
MLRWLCSNHGLSRKTLERGDAHPLSAPYLAATAKKMMLAVGLGQSKFLNNIN